MADYLTTDSELTGIANAIRTKGGTSAALTYPAGFVSAIEAISTATLTTKSIAENGTYNASSDNADGYSSVTVNVQTPVRTIIGTFTATSLEKGTSKTINLNYTGSGYPIAVQIFPSEGPINTDGTAYNKVQQYGILRMDAVKGYQQGQYAEPEYNYVSKKDAMYNYIRWKKSSTTGPSFSGDIWDTRQYNAGDASDTGAQTCIVFNSATVMKLFIANTSYGFMDGIEYTYIVTYSS